LGLTIDQLTEFVIVRPDGEIEVVNKDSNQDLWFAVRGGAGNFGVICEYKIKMTTFNNGNSRIVFNTTVYPALSCCFKDRFTLISDAFDK